MARLIAQFVSLNKAEKTITLVAEGGRKQYSISSKALSWATEKFGLAATMGEKPGVAVFINEDTGPEQGWVGKICPSGPALAEDLVKARAKVTEAEAEAEAAADAVALAFSAIRAELATAEMKAAAAKAETAFFKANGPKA